MALPVILLYIGSVLVAYIAVKRQKSAREDEDDDGVDNESD